jgi:hypothetical protein
MFDPIERSSAPSSAVLILDPCSSSRSFIDSQACCGDFPFRQPVVRSYLTDRGFGRGELL